jgi:hypothetical protein
MSYKTDRTKRVFKNGCYYDSETSTKVLAIAPYGQVNKAQCTKPVREPLIVKGY